MTPTFTFWPELREPVGIERHWSWQTWAEHFRTPRVAADKSELPGWAPVRFEGSRRAQNRVLGAFAVGIDVDHGETLNGVRERILAIGGGFLHTTWSHTPEEHRFRVILPLSRCVDAKEYAELWRRLAPAVGNVDPATKDPSRLWFVPGVPAEGAEYLFDELPGDWLDVDHWLAQPAPEEPRPALTPRTSTKPAKSAEARAVAYLDTMPGAISGAGGHQATFRAALALAKGFSLSEDDTFRLLWERYNPRCEPAWSERELRHKAAQAAKSSKLQDGYLLNEDPRFPYPEPPPGWDDPPGGDEFYAEKSDETEMEAEDPTGREPGDDSVEMTPQERLYETLPIFDLRDMYSRIAFQMSQEKPPRGLTTGHYQLDHLTNGFHGDMVTVMGAGTSCGKSSYAIMVQQENWKRHGLKSIIVSVEDSEITYSKRVVSALTGVNAIKIRDHLCNARDLDAIERHLPNVPSYPFLMYAGRMTAEEVAKSLPRVVDAFDIKLVIFDYIQRFKTKRSFTGDRRNQVTYACETLIDCVKQMKIPGIVLSQLKRTNHEEPDMDDLKESGDLENMADHVFLMWRKENAPDDNYNATYTRYVKVPKNKDGPVSTKGIEMKFNDRTAAFEAVVGQVFDEPEPDNDYDLDRYDTM